MVLSRKTRVHDLCLAIAFLAVAAIGAQAAFANSVAKGGGGYPAYPKLRPALDSDQESKVRRGEYLVKLADCMACHTDTDNEGDPFAGGLKIDTPFGALFSPNITPDNETGIGRWSDDDFVRAVREGIRPDGSWYYPVFPYNYFSKMSRDDVLAIKAYLDSIPAVEKADHKQEMNWPFNYRFLQFGWRLLYFYFADDAFLNSQAQSAAWNRGAFIVEGPGHCALCHTELNFLGVPEQEYYLAGTFVEGFYAPDITSRGLEGLSNASVAAVFSEDRKPGDIPFAGPMAEVEHNSPRFLTRQDALAVAAYLKSVKSESPPMEDTGGKSPGTEAGRKLYESSCKACHLSGAVGAPELTNSSAWDSLLAQGRERLYEIAVKGDGSMPARGGCSQCSDARIKAAVDYMIEMATKQH